MEQTSPWDMEVFYELINGFDSSPRILFRFGFLILCCFSSASLCTWCGTWKGDKLCSGCKNARYCSPKHQVCVCIVSLSVLLDFRRFNKIKIFSFLISRLSIGARVIKPNVNSFVWLSKHLTQALSVMGFLLLKSRKVSKINKYFLTLELYVLVI